MSMVGVGAVAVAVAVACMLPTSASALDQACTTGGYGGAEQVVTTPRPSGYQVTAVYGDGIYRATRCDSSGELVEGQTVAPITEPDGRTALVPSTYTSPKGDGSVLYGDPRDPVWARAWAADGERVKDDVIPPPKGVDVDAPAVTGVRLRETGPDELAARAAQSNDRCRNGSFVRYGTLARWPARRYSYRINGRSFGNNFRTRQSLVAGHKAWDNTVNDCHFSDRANIVSRYLGLTSRTARSNPDGSSVVDHGQIANITRCGNSRVIIACSWVQPGQSTGPYTENDQRYDEDYAWTNKGAVGGAYDYRSIATHETGHSIGLDHSTASPWLTMYPQATLSSTFWRTLALGDVLGMRNIYP